MTYAFGALKGLRDDFEMCVNNKRWDNWRTVMMRDVLSSWLDTIMKAGITWKKLPAVSLMLKFCEKRPSRRSRHSQLNRVSSAKMNLINNKTCCFQRECKQTTRQPGLYVDFVCHNINCGHFGQVVCVNAGQSCFMRIDKERINMALRCPECNYKLQYKREIVNVEAFKCEFNLVGFKLGRGKIAYGSRNGGKLTENLSWQWLNVRVSPQPAIF